MSDHRFSEASFRRYEQTFITLSNCYPAPLECNPAPYSVETFAARIRDSARAFYTNRWHSDDLDPDEFWKKWSTVEVIRGKVSVLLRPRALAAAPTILPLPSSPDTFKQGALADSFTLNDRATLPGLVVTNTTMNIARALLFLHNELVIQVPTTLHNIPPDVALYIKTQEDFPDIGYKFHDEQTCVIA
jgi:hypothetical protein